MLATLAEMRKAAGFVLHVSVNDTARQVEIALEQGFVNHDLLRFQHKRVPSDLDEEGDPFVFLLSGPADAEQVFWVHTQLCDLTKMGLARRLEVEQGRNRLTCYSDLDKLAMILLIQPGYIPPAPADGKGKGGRGRGKGRGRGHG